MKYSSPAFIVFEGIDGSGKTTISKKLYNHIKKEGNKVVWLREPSDSEWGKKIRELAEIYDEIPLDEELRLFTEDRKWDVKNNINPALKENSIVILDRYFYSSACYQGAKGLNVNNILELNRKFSPSPDALFIIDVNIETAIKRIELGRESHAILFEKRDYLEKVRENYLSLNENNMFVINGNNSIDEVFSETLKCFNQLFLL